MAKFTKKMQANTIKLIALNRVELESYNANGELQPGATLDNVAYLIESIPFFKEISLKQSNTFSLLPDNKVLIRNITVSPCGTVTATREIVLRLVGIGSYEFLNCL